MARNTGKVNVMAGRTFVLSDLHGHYRIFLKMLEKIHFGDEDELYILGDCCDRGSHSMEIYLFLSKHRDNIYLLKGNHEIMMRDAFISADKKSPQRRMWKDNGGEKTIESYHGYLRRLGISEEKYEEAKQEFYQRMIDYINTCPNFVEREINGQKFVLIHAGINPEKTLYEQTEEECAWMREWFYMSPGLKDKLIIFGHTPTCFLHTDSKCFDIWKDPVYRDKIGIDGGLGPFETGQLNCICLNDMSVYVIKKTEEPEEA